MVFAAAIHVRLVTEKAGFVKLSPKNLRQLAPYLQLEKVVTSFNSFLKTVR